MDGKGDTIYAAVALQIIRSHSGATNRLDSRVDGDDNDDDDDDDGSKTVSDISVIKDTSFQVSRKILSSKFNPNMDYKPAASSIAFENYCSLSGIDAACASFRNMRNTWLHAEIAKVLTPLSTRSSLQNFQPRSIESIVNLFDLISQQCDRDLTTIVQVAGRARWRQFGELYKTGANDCCTRIKQIVVPHLQSEVLSLESLSMWLVACLRSEQLCSRDFLHQAGKSSSTRPKSGGLLKTSNRPPSADGGRDLLLSNQSSISNDAAIMKLFSDKIIAAVNEEVFEKSFNDNLVETRQFMPLLHCQQDFEKWPRKISQTLFQIWDIGSSFLHLFYVESKNHNASHQQIGLEAVAHIIRIFLEHRCGFFAQAIDSNEFAKHETKVLLCLAETNFIERQLNAMKTNLTAGEIIHRLVSESRELARKQLDAMHARLIAINARLLLDALILDWRPYPIADGSDNGPRTGLVAWGIYMTNWQLRLTTMIAPLSCSHIYLSVLLASFERLTAKILNSGSNEVQLKRDKTVALAILTRLMLISQIKIPGLFGSSFKLSTTSPFSSISQDLQPYEIRDLISSINALADMLSTGDNFWLVDQLQTTGPEDFLVTMSMLLWSCHKYDSLNLLIRIICSEKILPSLLCQLGLKENGQHHNNEFVDFLACLKEISHFNSSNLLSYAARLICQSQDSESCETLRNALANDFMNQNSYLELVVLRLLNQFESSHSLGTLPCGCSFTYEECFQNLLESYTEILLTLMTNVSPCLKVTLMILDHLKDGNGIISFIVYLTRMIGNKYAVVFNEIADTFVSALGEESVENLTSGRRRRRHRQEPSPRQEQLSSTLHQLVNEIKNSYGDTQLEDHYAQQMISEQISLELLASLQTSKVDMLEKIGHRLKNNLQSVDLMKNCDLIDFVNAWNNSNVMLLSSSILKATVDIAQTLQ